MPVGMYILALFIAGLLLPFQTGMNAEMAKHTSGIQAVFLSVLVGLPLVALMIIPSGLPSVPQMKAMPWWAWAGGLLGICYIFTVTISAKHTGALALVGAITTGQIIGSAVVDHYGLAGFPRNPVTLWRIGGALLVGVGVWMSTKGVS